jgi:hypothetical protein
MSLHQSPTTANLPRIATREKHTYPSRSPARQTRIQRMIQDVRHIHAAIGFSGSAILCVGGALAILCTMSAVQAGAPYPISFAAGFCTLACSAGFCAALVAIVNVTGTVTPITEKPQPNHAAWKLAGKLRVSDASRLWCNIEPGCAASQDSLAWAQAMLNAIKAGELPVIKAPGESQDAIDRDRSNPSWATEIDRHALRAWAHSHGHSPRFLID